MPKDHRVMEALGMFMQIWNRDVRYSNTTYHPSPKDYGAIRDLLALSDVPLGTIALHTRQYLTDDWWYAQRHPASGLFRNFMRYAPKSALTSTVKPMLIRCDLCEQTHAPDVACDPARLDEVFRRGGA